MPSAEDTIAKVNEARTLQDLAQCALDEIGLDKPRKSVLAAIAEHVVVLAEQDTEAREKLVAKMDAKVIAAQEAAEQAAQLLAGQGKDGTMRSRGGLFFVIEQTAAERRFEAEAANRRAGIGEYCVELTGADAVIVAQRTGKQYSVEADGRLRVHCEGSAVAQAVLQRCLDQRRDHQFDCAPRLVAMDTLAYQVEVAAGSDGVGCVKDPHAGMVLGIAAHALKVDVLRDSSGAPRAVLLTPA